MKAEPVALAAAIAAAVNAVVVFVFGEELSEEQIGGIVIVVTLIGGWVGRSRATPVG